MPVRPWDRRVLALVCALAISAGRAAAQSASLAPAPIHVALDYQTDPTLSDCPSTAELSAAIAKQLGYDPFAPSPDGTSHRLKASIQRTPTGTEAHIEWLTASGASEGERRLGSESQDCAEVSRGLSFAIGVQLQLRASAEAAPVPPPPTPPPAPQPAKSAPPPPPKRT